MVLNGDPKGKNFLYCNGKHVIIRDINVSRMGGASVNLTMKDVLRHCTSFVEKLFTLKRLKKT